MRAALEAIVDFSRSHKLKVIGIRPNSDPGSYDILRAIDEIQASDAVRFFHTLPRKVFVNLVRNALCLVGNSSMGILEAPMYRLPVVNIGNRQKGRLNAGNVVFTTYQKDEIKRALKQACFDLPYREMVRNLQNPYGDEYAPDRVVDFLQGVDISNKAWYLKKKLCIEE